MRLLFLNTSASAGGAAIAAQRLAAALRQRGHEVRFVCREGRDVAFYAERLRLFLQNGCTRRGLFSVDPAWTGRKVAGTADYEWADAVHFHWVNQGFLSLKEIGRLLHGEKPCIWTLHDMWAFTGVCHQAKACERWREACHTCPQLQRPAAKDAAHQTFLRKQAAYDAARVAWVAPSRWLAQTAEASALLQGQKVHTIPNPLDTNHFAPLAPPEREALRRRLGIPEGARALLFTAFRVTDEGKGLRYLREALQGWGEKNVVLLLAGHDSHAAAQQMPVPTLPQGYISDPQQMRALYQAADVLVMPTLADTFPNTIAEAQACGTSAVVSCVGGVPEMVEEGATGFLSAPRDAQSLAQSLARALQPEVLAAQRAAACLHALTAYAPECVAAQYEEVYAREMEARQRLNMQKK